MAERRSAKRKSGPATARPDPEQRVLDAAMRLAALQGWADTTLADIAAEAELPLEEMYRRFPTKYAVLEAFVRRIDETVLAGTDPGIGAEPVRDRLFDVLMRRFDALRPYKDGVRAVLRDLARDPPTSLKFGLGPMRRSSLWMLEAARIEPWRLLQPLQLQGYRAIYLYVLRAWLGDDSEDSGRTMAALDTALQRAESLLSFLPIGRRRGGRAEEAPAGD